MTLGTSENNQLAHNASARLARLDDCPRIQPEEQFGVLVCANCGFTVYAIAGGFRHSEAEIRAMRHLAAIVWPVKTVVKDIDGLAEFFSHGSGRSQDTPR